MTVNILTGKFDNESAIYIRTKNVAIGGAKENFLYLKKK